MPAPGKPIEVFQQEDAQCREYALQAIGGANAVNDAIQQQAASAFFGALVGAAAGALLGTGFGDAGAGAAIGAGAGLATGVGSGTALAVGSSVDLQQRYNIAYMQCMYAKGNQVPGQIR